MEFVVGLGYVLQVCFFYWWSGITYNVNKIQTGENKVFLAENMLYDMMIRSKRKFFYERGIKKEKISRIIVGVLLSFYCLYFQKSWERQWLAFLFYCILWLILKIDWKTMIIPNECILILFLFSVVTSIFVPEITWLNRVFSFCIISIPMCIISVFTKGSIGGGDIKLMAVAGLFLGWKCSIYAFIYGMFGSGIYGVYLLLWKKQSRKAVFPLGPFLCGGIILSHSFF